MKINASTQRVLGQKAIYIPKTKADITMSVETITPSIAKKMLELNAINRPLSEATVIKYANDIREGRWSYNGQDIIFSNNGFLIDGQHRLHAIVRTGEAVEVGVKRGVPAQSFTTIDAGRTRTAGDVLAIMNVPRYNRVAAAGRIALRYSKGLSARASGRDLMTRTEVTDFVSANPYIQAAVELASPTSKLMSSAFPAVIFLANSSRLFDDQINEFIGGVSDGVGLHRGDPRLTLREWVFSERLRSRNCIQGSVLFNATARAWNAWARGESLKLIKAQRDPRIENTEIVGFQKP